MPASYLQLTYGQVALATLLILVNGLISLALGLHLGKSLALAAVRTVVQLLLIGLVLEWIFHTEHWLVVIVLLCLMTVVAAVTAVQRNERRYPGIWLNTVVSIWASSWLVAAYALAAVLQVGERWYQPQYVIPLLGMILGNALNGITLGQNAFADTLVARRDQVEALLALGANRWEAARPAVQHAVRTGMVPIINTMLVAGLVSLPGMMTGQILSGTPPIEAVKYQIVIMFVIASAAALGTVGVVLLSVRGLFNADHQFLYERLRQR